MSSLITPSLVARLNTLITTENRKRNKELALISREELTQQFEQLIYFIKINMVYSVPDLHVYLSNYVNSFYPILKALQEEEKPKLGKHDLTNWQNSWMTLNQWFSEHEEEIKEGFEGNWESIIYRDLYELPTYAYRSIDNYFNHLLSKTVDYFPKGKSLAPLANLVNEFVGEQGRLEEFIELGVHWWVYIFTENVRYVPYTFKQLNGVEGGLGKQIETWTKPDNDDPVLTLVQEAGYNQVFGGWGGLKLDGLFVEETTEQEGLVQPQTKTNDKPEEKFFEIPNQKWISEVLRHLEAVLHSYINNQATYASNSVHASMIIRSIATTMMYFTGAKPLRRKDFMLILNGLKSLFKKNPAFSKRRDKKDWFAETWIKPTNLAIEEMVSQVNAVPSLVIQQVFHTVVLPHRLRLATDEEKYEHFISSTDKLVRFLDGSYNEVYYSKDYNYTELAVGNILVLYTRYLEERYRSMTPMPIPWYYLAGLEYWLDIYNPRRVEVVIDAMKGHFIKCHPTAKNEQVVKEMSLHVTMLSLRNKPLLTEAIKSLKEEVPNYGKSHLLLDQLIDLNESEIKRLSTRQPPKYEVNAVLTPNGEEIATYTVNGRDMLDIYNEIDQSRPCFKVKDVTL